MQTAELTKLIGTGKVVEAKLGKYSRAYGIVTKVARSSAGGNVADVVVVFGAQAGVTTRVRVRDVTGVAYDSAADAIVHLEAKKQAEAAARQERADRYAAGRQRLAAAAADIADAFATLGIYVNPSVQPNSGEIYAAVNLNEGQLLKLVELLGAEKAAV